MSKKKSNKKNHPSTTTLEVVVDIFKLHPNQCYNCKQVAAAMELDKALRDALRATLDKLVKQDVLESPEEGVYRLNREENRFIVGKVDMTKTASAYIIPDTMETLETDTEDTPPPTDVFVAEHNMNQALHGDRVRVKIFNKKNGRSEGEVVEIIERSRRTYVGKIDISHHYGFVMPDSRHMPYDIFITEAGLKGAVSGQKVVAHIVEWKKGMKCPTGEIIDVLGDAGDNDVEMHAILAEFDLPYTYPEQVTKLAEKINPKIKAADYAARRDFRMVPTFTIDPVDAKDFDDALSIQHLSNGNWEVGVHIADVTHYVDTHSGIDLEAQERATSIYLVDRTIPMLPERLSNFICSLRPDEEKLCFSAVFELNDKGTIQKEWYGRTVILSRRRFTYEEAQQVIETGEGDYRNEILTLDGLAKILREKRFKAGAVTFEREEPRFEIDEAGKPIRVYFKEMKDSNQLIEEFMLLANRKVAERIGKKVAGRKPRTFVYRVHNKPNEEKLQNFREFIKKFGYKLDTEEERNISKEMNKVLKEVKGKPEANLIETLAVRSMAKAVYSTENAGHYGLAFPHYTHFTSPIRRYPDMMVHRLLAHYLDGGKSEDKERYEQLCKHSSSMEQRAAEAERASIKYKMVEFMQDKVGLEFDGIISGVTEWGIYVELIENKIEGMVSVRSMKDDYYYYDEENYCMIGRSTNKIYTLGNKVRIRVSNSDLIQKHLDFVMADAGEDIGSSRASSGFRGNGNNGQGGRSKIKEQQGGKKHYKSGKKRKK